MTDEITPTPGPQGGTGGGGTQSAPTGTDGGQAPPWGENFNPERAWKTIQNLRKFEETAAEQAKQIAKLEDASKSEAERVASERDREKLRADSAESRLARYEVAVDKGLPANYAARLVGSTKAELEADADKMIEEFGLDVGDSSGGGGGRQQTSFDQGVRTTRAKTGDMNDMIRTAAGRGR